MRKITYKDFIKKMLLFFPSANSEYINEKKKYDMELETVIIEDIFVPRLLALLEKNNDKESLRNVFQYFEEVSVFGTEDFLNTFSVTVLESLGNDKEILKAAKLYMLPRTTLLQWEADKDLGRI